MTRARETAHARAQRADQRERRVAACLGLGKRSASPARTGGFTLVESIVSLLVVGIVLAAVAGVLVFGSNMMAHQRAVSNAQTLASTVRTSLEGALEGATSATAAGSGKDIRISFTTGSTTQYLGSAGSSYTIAIGQDASGTGEADADAGAAAQSGRLTITSEGSGDSGDLLPASTYLDGDTVALAANGRQLTVTVYSREGAELAQTATGEVLSPVASSAEGGEA